MGKVTRVLPQNLPALRKDGLEFAKPKMGVAVLQVFRDANLLMMHAGCMALCRKHGIKADEMPLGTSVLFVNRRRKYIKLLLCNNSEYPIVAALHLPPGIKFPKAAFDVETACVQIARSLNTPQARIEPTKALRQVMERYGEKTEDR